MADPLLDSLREHKERTEEAINLAIFENKNLLDLKIINLFSVSWGL